jgi:hypothetical protein
MGVDFIGASPAETPGSSSPNGLSDRHSVYPGETLAAIPFPEKAIEKEPCDLQPPMNAD